MTTSIEIDRPADEVFGYVADMSVASTADGGCTVSAVVRGDAPGPMKLLGPLLPMHVRSSVRKDYERLKALLEAD